MLRFVSVRELKEKASELLRRAEEGEEVVVTRNGKPKALLLGFAEDEIEEYLLANHPALRRRLEEAWEEYLKVGGRKIGEIIREEDESG
jgi:prevent-host-death family protein